MARRRKQFLPWLFSGALLVASLCLVGVKRQERRAQEQAEQERQEQQRLSQAFQEAMGHERASNWKQAQAVLESLQSTAPNYPGVKYHLERVKKELSNQEHLDKARAALTEKRLDDAEWELKLVSADTAMSAQLRKLKSDLPSAALSEHAAQLQAEQATQLPAGQPQPMVSDIVGSAHLRQVSDTANTTAPPSRREPGPTPRP